MRNFRNLDVWQKSHGIALAAYKVTANFPKEERYGLISQIRRCAASIPANIAEGCGRAGDGEFARFLQIAMGSASEFEYHILLAHDLTFLSPDTYNRLHENIVEVKRMLASLIMKVNHDRNSC
ncbi:MAG: four helix bundle protein [Phycisphaerae bacterium]|nr:four helix bundle protein [Phycisphaerae bacterium]